jgi:hypothetical protein
MQGGKGMKMKWKAKGRVERAPKGGEDKREDIRLGSFSRSVTYFFMPSTVFSAAC